MTCVFLIDMFPYELCNFKINCCFYLSDNNNKKLFPMSCTKISVQVHDFSRVSIESFNVNLSITRVLKDQDPP